MPDTTYDVAIVGGGPAGLSGALWLARYLHSVVVLDAGDPRNWETLAIHGYLGLADASPPELRKRGRQQCEEFGVTFVNATVSCVDKINDDLFRLALEDGVRITAQRLLLAIGIVDVWPDVPGLDRCYGATAHVCPDCDGYECRDKKTIVIASGRQAAGLAFALTTWTNEIVICTDGAPADMTQEMLAKLDALNIPIVEAPITCVKSSHREATCVELAGTMSLDCDQIFFSIRQEPSDDLGKQLGCKRDKIGRVVTDEHYHSSVKNVYAAGDIVHAPEIAIGAAASGAIAAMAIHHSLVPASRKLD